jgi:hypothetical protein
MVVATPKCFRNERLVLSLHVIRLFLSFENAFVSAQHRDAETAIGWQRNFRADTWGTAQKMRRLEVQPQRQLPQLKPIQTPQSRKRRQKVIIFYFDSSS